MEPKTTAPITPPNLFEIATSELSQDAFLTWLIKWGDPQYAAKNKDLYECSVNFIQELLDTNEAIESVEAGRQWKNIDVWAIVNNKYFLIIEDKKGTKEHSNQLIRYKEAVKEEYPTHSVAPVYYKMDEQSNFAAVEDAGYSILSRSIMLRILTPFTESDSIVNEYYTYLKNLDAAVNSYKSQPLNQDWNWFAWRGFFTKLQKEIGEGEWDYVANASGGFLGFWWRWNDIVLSDDTRFRIYLQLEYNKLIVKAECPNQDTRHHIKQILRSHLFPVAEELGINLKKYGRVGNYMGVVKLEEDYRTENQLGVLDLERTLSTLRKAENLVDRVCKQLAQTKPNTTHLNHPR